MKTIKNFMFVAFAATSILACQKEMVDLNDVPASGEVVSFVGRVDDSQTKTYIEYEDGKTSFTTLFTANDKITVNGVQSPESTPSEDGREIAFKVEGVEAPYFAMTTTQIAKEDGKYISFNTNSYAYTLMFSGKASPQKYTRVSDGNYTSFQSNTDILAAYSEGENLYFQHMSTFYAITVDAENSTSEKKIKTIYVCQGDKDGVFGNIAGRWYLQFDKDNNFTPIMKPSANLTSLIAFDCGEEGLAHGTTMIIGLPAYNYENGLVFTLLDVDGNLASYKVKAEKTQHAADGGMLIPFKPAFCPKADTVIPGLITTAAQWNAFAEFMNSAEKTDEGWARWFVDGTLRIGADIKGDLASVNELPAGYVIDGTGKTITRENATAALLGTVSGEVKNLTLAGKVSLSKGGASIVDELKGGKITKCTNAADIVFDAAAHGNVAGIVRLVSGGTIEGCTNSGSINAKVVVSATNYNAVVGGVISQIHASDNAVTVKDCSNTAEIILAPVSGQSNGTGMAVCGLGGIAGWLRSASSIVFDNCDNSGAVTLSADNVVSDRGFIAYSMSVGGVVGLATPINSSGDNKGLINTPSGSNGLDVILKNCDNSGVVHNCGINYSTTKQTNTKIFTGGLAGSLLGNESKYAEISNCSNTGNVYTYDLIGESSSSRPGYSAVVGGLVGFGGYLDIQGTTVNCQVGSGKRPVVAMAGVIGFAERPFNLTESNVYITGYFQRFEGYKGNRAVVAVVPVRYGTKEADAMGMVPNVNGSTITKCNLGGLVLSLVDPLTADDKTDISGTLTVKLFNTADKVYKEDGTVNNLVCGQGYNTVATDVTVTGFSFWDGK